MNTVTTHSDLYRRHAAPNTVPQGNLRTDMSPRRCCAPPRSSSRSQPCPASGCPSSCDLSEYRSPDFSYDTTSAEEVERLLEDVPLNRGACGGSTNPTRVLFYADADSGHPLRRVRRAGRHQPRR